MREAETSPPQHSHRSPVALFSNRARRAGSVSSNRIQSRELNFLRVAILIVIFYVLSDTRFKL